MVESAFGFVITVAVKIVDIIAIDINVPFFIGKDHGALGTTEIHAGIKKIYDKVIISRKEIKYRIMLLPFRVLIPRKCPYSGSYKCLFIHIPRILRRNYCGNCSPGNKIASLIKRTH